MRADEPLDRAAPSAPASGRLEAGMARAAGSRLALRAGLVLAGLLALVLLAFTVLIIQMWTRSSVDMAVSETERFTDTLQRSGRYAMMHAQRESLHDMINAVGRQKDIEWVRIFNQEGKVSYSTQTAEIGAVLDQNAEACYRCHQAEAPLAKLAGPDRSRILTAGDGHRVLATIEPIYNEPSCAADPCHVHPASQRVLGVLDVALSLEPTDRLIRARALTVAVCGLAAIALVCALVAFALHRYVGGPVRRLVTGTQKIAGGDFDHRIPVSGNDELAALARSFNAMTESLGRAYAELRALASTLEDRVEEKTSELKAAQLQVVRAEKLASLGRLAAGVAHELNNPLTGVLTFAHLVARKVPPDSQQAADLQVIIAETNRCAKIIRDLLQFARETEVNRKPENLNEIVRQTVSILQPQSLFHNIQVRLALDDGLPKIVLDAAHLRQVLMNIILNAAEAMAHQGELLIATSALPPDRIVLTVTDTGCGIAPENLGRIFDPFFTTKAPGKGTGLGLAVSLKLVENHGGTIEVSSALGQGSTFRVILPVQGPPKE